MAYKWGLYTNHLQALGAHPPSSFRGLGLVSGCNAGKSWVAWVSGAIGSFLKVWLGPVTNMDVYMYIYTFTCYINISIFFGYVNKTSIYVQIIKKLDFVSSCFFFFVFSTELCHRLSFAIPMIPPEPLD